MHTCSMDNPCPSQSKKNRISRLRKMPSSLVRCLVRAWKMMMPRLRLRMTSKRRPNGWKLLKISGTSTTRTTQVILIAKRWYLLRRLH